MNTETTQKVVYKQIGKYSVSNELFLDLIFTEKCQCNCKFCIAKTPEYAEENWNYIRDYYKNVFKRYEKVNQEELLKKQSRYMLDLLRTCKNSNYRVNIRRFLHELDTYENFSQFNY